MIRATPNQGHNSWERTDDDGQDWKALCEFTSTRVEQ
jgi:hypothetical protein